jgi:hypothetical protein
LAGLRRFAIRLALSAVLVLVLGACVACGSGASKDQLADREISDQELPLMVLPKSELGEPYQHFVGDGHFSTNEDEIRDPEGRDPADIAADIERCGRMNGYYSAYQSRESMISDDMLFAVTTGVELHKTAEGACGFTEVLHEEMQESIGRSYVGRTTKQVDSFDPGHIGDESLGLKVLVEVLSDPTDTVPSYWYVTVVVFCRGPIAGSVSIVRPEDTNVQDEVRDLAGKLERRIEDVINGEITG